ncbi:hypothetical protein TRVA0_001S00298 [Trichomonascus vanleenenianus]|uniref:uncharacterized protein n=1 Tax=Trichomonascus vanleenenianus TaxID=2268995 RepID=UPI003EC9A4D4
MSIILEKIPDGTTIEQVLAGIREYTNRPVSARIVNSNAVVSFRSIDLATQFALDHAKVRVRGQELNCFFNDEESTAHAERRKRPKPYSQPRPSTGKRDIGTDSTPFVLLRNRPSAKSRDIFSELNDKDIWPRRLLEVRNNLTNTLMPYCFLEFGSPLEASKAIDAIAAKKIAVGTASPIHFGVFKPSGRLEPQFVSSSGVGMVYWEREYVISEVEGIPHPPTTIVPTDSEHRNISPSSSEIQPKKKRKIIKKVPLPTRPQSNSSAAKVEEFESFSDLDRLSCYLCRRKFATPIALGDHERYSELHQENLHTPEKLELARKISAALKESATLMERH